MADSPDDNDTEIERLAARLKNSRDPSLPYAVYHRGLDMVEVFFRECYTIDQKINGRVSVLIALYPAQGESSLAGFQLRGVQELLKNKYGEKFSTAIGLWPLSRIVELFTSEFPDVLGGFEHEIVAMIGEYSLEVVIGPERRRAYYPP